MCVCALVEVKPGAGDSKRSGSEWNIRLKIRFVVCTYKYISVPEMEIEKQNQEMNKHFTGEY